MTSEEVDQRQQEIHARIIKSFGSSFAGTTRKAKEKGFGEVALFLMDNLDADMRERGGGDGGDEESDLLSIMKIAWEQARGRKFADYR